MEFETEKVNFQRISPDDEKFYIDIYSSPRLTKLINLELSVDQAKQAFHSTLKATKQANPKYRISVIESFSSAEPLGFVALQNIDYANKAAEVGIILRRHAQGKGYAFHCMEAVITFAFHNLKLQHLYAKISLDNKPSLKLIQRLGFQPVASPSNTEVPFGISTFIKTQETI